MPRKKKPKTITITRNTDVDPRPARLELRRTKDEASVSATGYAVLVCGVFGIVAMCVWAYVHTHS